MTIKKEFRGFSLVELVLAIGVFAILASGVTYVATNSYTNFYGAGNKQNIAEFAQEGIEAVRSVRDNSWQDIEDISGEGNKGVNKDDGYWSFSGSSDTRDGLTRTVNIANAQRDSDGNIVDSGGTEDPRTKQVTVTVSASGVEDYTLVTFLTDWSHKVWNQTDWSGVGDSEFWASSDTASSTFSNISTSTAGSLKLSQSAGEAASTYGDWENLVSDASVDVGATTYDLKVSTSTDMIYVTGDYGTDKFKAYDKSSARSGTISFSWEADLSNFTYGGACIALHPNGDYAYVGQRYHGAGKTGDESIAIVELGDDHTVTYAAKDIFNFKCNNLVIDGSGDYIYALSDYGQIVVYQTGSGGSTVTIQGSTQQITGSTSFAMSAGLIDNETDDLYVTMENATGVGAHHLKRMDTTTKSALSTDFGIDEDSNYMMGIAAIDDSSSGNNRFIVSTTDSSQDAQTFEDTGSAFTKLDYHNTTGASEKGIVFDGDHDAISYDYYGNIFVIDVTNPRQLAATISDTASRATTPYSVPIHYIEYDAEEGGIFILEKDGLGVNYLHFMMRPTGASDPDWQELEDDADADLSGQALDLVLTSDGNTAWSCGAVDHDLQEYDISGVEDDPGSISAETTIDTGLLTGGCRSMAMTSGDDYIYMGAAFSLDGSNLIAVVDVASETIDSYASMPPSSGMNLGVQDMFVDSNDEFLYVTSVTSGGLGDLAIFEIDSRDGSLTIQGTTQNISDKVINDMWLDVDNDLLYTVGDSATDTFARYDVSTKSAASEDYYESDTADYVQIEYIENVGGKNRFAILTEDGTDEIIIAEDNTSSLTQLDSIYDSDLSMGHGLAYDTVKDYIFAVGYDGDMVSIDISDREDIVAGPVKDTSTYAYTPGNSYPYHYLWYDSNNTGLWFSEKIATDDTHLKFINGPDEPPETGGVYSAGTLYSSIFDIGSTGQELLEISVEQDVPSDCDLNITLEADNDITFASKTTQVFSDHTDGFFTSSTSATLNGKRFLRYLVGMSPCSGVEENESTPTLYDLNIKYR